MGLIKQTQTSFGVSAEYWRIIQVNRNLDRKDMVVDLACYVSATTRIDGVPVKSIQFNFTADDHPISEVLADSVNADLLDDWDDFDLHLVYVHIKNIAAVATAKATANIGLAEEDKAKLTANEEAALELVGATDLL